MMATTHNSSPGNESFAQALDGYDSEMLFALGRNLFGQARHAESELVFRLLMMRDPMNQRFVKAHAAALQAVGNHSSAMVMHMLDFAMNTTDLSPCVNQSECLMALGREQEAVASLQAIVHACGVSQQTTRVRAEALLKILGATSTTSPKEDLK